MSEKPTVQSNVDAIVASIKSNFRDENDMCVRQGTGSHERVQNVEQVKHSTLACERARHAALLPNIQIGEVDEFGSCAILLKGAHADVVVRVTDGPLAKYIKKDETDVAGEAPVEDKKVWARLARWAATGKKKFVG